LPAPRRETSSAATSARAGAPLSNKRRPQPQPPSRSETGSATTAVRVSRRACRPSAEDARQASSVREPENERAFRGGSFAMGGNEEISEKPVHQVTIKPFAIGKFPVSVREWNELRCRKSLRVRGDRKKMDAPITNVSWSDAKAICRVARGSHSKGVSTPKPRLNGNMQRAEVRRQSTWWGDQFQYPVWPVARIAVTSPRPEQPTKVGSSKPKSVLDCTIWAGGVDQWVEDCWHKNYQGRSDGRFSMGRERMRLTRHFDLVPGRMMRGYARPSKPATVTTTNVRYPTHGFIRVATVPLIQER